MSRPVSLTALGQVAALALVAAAVGVCAWLAGFDPAQVRLMPAPDSQDISPIARRLIVYRLDAARPTVFRFTQPIAQARVVTQPVLSRSAVGPGQGWNYTIRAELLDDAGSVLATRDFSSRSILLDAQGARVGPRRYYRGSTDEIAMGDEIRIAFAQPFAGLRLTVAGSDPGLRYVDVRVSERRPLIASAAESAFRRLSPEDQVRLAEPNAFPPALLTAAESTAIAINQWRPVGPLGIEGRDHLMAVLYEEEAQAGVAWEYETEEETGE